MTKLVFLLFFFWKRLGSSPISPFPSFPQSRSPPQLFRLFLFSLLFKIQIGCKSEKLFVTFLNRETGNADLSSHTCQSNRFSFLLLSLSLCFFVATRRIRVAVPVRRSVRPSVHPSVRPSVRPSLRPSVRPSSS